MEFYDDFLGLGYYGIYEIDELGFNHDYIIRFMPFIAKVMPRISSKQNSSGYLDIIYFEQRRDYPLRGPLTSTENGRFFVNCREEIYVRFGLDPLIRACIISSDEGYKILNWFEKVLDNPKNTEHLAKRFSVDEKEYLLFTYCDGSKRALSLASENCSLR